MISLLSFLRRDPRKYLGRWTIDYCDKILHEKIRLANEDHCGTCGTVIKQRNLKHKHIGGIRKYETNSELNRRYNEYINNAIRNRRATTTQMPDDVDTQIAYYISTR